MEMPDLFGSLPPAPRLISLPHLAHFLLQLQREWEHLPLRRKACLITQIARHFLSATHNHLSDLRRVTHEVCSTSAPRKTQKKRTAPAPNRQRIRKNEAPVQDHNEISLEAVLEEVEEQQRNAWMAKERSMMVTPSRQPSFPRDPEPTVPPFHPQIMAMMNAEMNSQRNSSTQNSEDKWTPQLAEYQSMLGLTQKGIEVLTGRKERGRTRTKTVPKRAVDNRIVVREGDQFLRQLQLLQTKVKVSKERETDEGDYFCQQLARINPALLKIDLGREQLRDHHYRAINQAFESFSRVEISQQVLFGDIPQHPEEEGLFSTLEEDDPSRNEQLQAEVTRVVAEELKWGESTTLKGIVQKHGLTRDLEAELFFQLLHMDFRLEQKNPQQFGPILIDY